MTQHTPGPWTIKSARANEAKGAPLESEIRGGNYVVVRLGALNHELAQANASLIAAAPDLLAALRAVNDAYSFISETAPAPIVHAIRKARAAIAKAEGRRTTEER